jgi:uncharacterized protein
VTPGSDFKPQNFRYFDYAAYYRQVRHSLERAVENGAQEDLYPEPKPHCEICRWRSSCEAKWRQDDHLTLVQIADRGARQARRDDSRRVCGRSLAAAMEA